MTQVQESFRNVWKEWKIPAIVLLSFTLQTILILMGSRRKYSARNRLRFFTWMAYLLSESVVLVSLNFISNFRDDKPANHPSHVMKAFWAPFLLLHLGGPDTITAYSMEDIETWQKNAVIVGGQVLITVYISISAWYGKGLNFLYFPMLLAGIFKSGERIYAMRCASSERFRRSMFHSPDPGPNYAKYMDEYSSKRAEGFRVSSERIVEVRTVGHHVHSVPANNFVPDAASLQDAYFFFDTFKRLFADLILNIHDVVNSRSFFQSRTCEEVFRVIEIELGFMYDVLYTKAVLVYSSIAGRFCRGVTVICRIMTILCFVAVLVIFCVIDMQSYSRKDVYISCVLLAGAVTHEIYAVGWLLLSDWTMLWLSRQTTRSMHLLYRVISLFSLSKRRRWSNKIAQFDLMSFCLDYKPPRCHCVGKSIKSYDVQSYVHVTIPAELKELLFQQLLKKSRSAEEDPSVLRKLCSHRGDWVLSNENCDDKLGWSIQGEFDQSILLWHIATDLCYYTDLDENDPETNGSSNSTSRRPNPRNMSKMLSEYMLYILAVRSFMLPDGIGYVRFQDTCAEAIEFFKEKKSIAGGKKAACRALLKVNTDVQPWEVKGDGSKSVLFDACRLAKDLQQLEAKQSWGKDKKWELMSNVWVEMLSYAASQCHRNQHAQQLRRGGELLTHVWFLMAHLGITKQFQISNGHARTKLIVE